MSDFIIPKGLPFDFIIKVIEQDSFLPQDVSNMVSGTFSIIANDTPDVVVTSTTLEHLTDIIVETVNTTEYDLNGMLKGSLTNTQTGSLAFERGAKVDGYYLKPLYFGVVVITFDDGTPSISTVITNILVTPTGN